MDTTSLIHTYGYIIVFLATIFNLSTVIVLSGLAVHEGYIGLWQTILVAFAGTVFFSQIYFVAGRKGGHKLIAKHPEWKDKMDKMTSKVEHHHAGFTFFYRFILGFRFVTPLLLGPTRVPFRKFTVWNILGALLWSVVFVLLGYYVGAGVKAIMKEAGQYEWYAVGVIVVFGAIFWWIRHIYKKRKRCREQNS